MLSQNIPIMVSLTKGRGRLPPLPSKLIHNCPRHILHSGLLNSQFFLHIPSSWVKGGIQKNSFLGTPKNVFMTVYLELPRVRGKQNLNNNKLLKQTNKQFNLDMFNIYMRPEQYFYCKLCPTLLEGWFWFIVSWFYINSKYV